ncbi:hypothetical protein D0T50_10645 [Bacteroides sp. 214]|uniref:SemiSWEET family sugar transporter n=1 Tax=Bacteroides sp. 214 TaxID=2302935 RepID=UPI0013D5B9E5|nr:SemiSWEET family transporter [Bacteroides sp. 214]NDW13347.1 hypothetical protein [Bacteroides sp. 214]
MNFTDVIGYAATICMIFGYLPQTIRTIRTRSTDDIAVGTFLLMGLGSIFFMIQGFLLGNYPLAITNVLTTIMSTTIFSIKMVNDIRKRRLLKK